PPLRPRRSRLARSLRKPARDLDPSRAAVEQQIRAHDLERLLRDREAESEASSVATGRGAEAPLKPLEVRTCGLSIDHIDLDDVAGYLTSLDDELPAGSVPRRVRDQVDQRLDQQVRVGEDGHVLVASHGH